MFFSQRVEYVVYLAPIIQAWFLQFYIANQRKQIGSTSVDWFSEGNAGECSPAIFVYGNLYHSQVVNLQSYFHLRGCASLEILRRVNGTF